MEEITSKPLQQGCPRFIIVGVSGAGKTELASALGAATGLEVIENDSLAENALGEPLQDVYIADAELAQTTAVATAQELLADEGSGKIVVLMPTPGADPAVLHRIERCRAGGSTVIGVDAPLEDLVRRSGLNAPQLGYLGTPRAWFRQLHASLRSKYESVCDIWFDTAHLSPEEIANSLLTPDELDLGASNQ